jgi:hypothetical protein
MNYLQQGGTEEGCACGLPGWPGRRPRPLSFSGAAANARQPHSEGERSTAARAQAMDDADGPAPTSGGDGAASPVGAPSDSSRASSA